MAGKEAVMRPEHTPAQRALQTHMAIMTGSIMGRTATPLGIGPPTLKAVVEIDRESILLVACVGGRG